jgi:hypothetical protein
LASLPEEKHLALRHPVLKDNPSNSGGRDQKDHSSKPARANSSRDPILKKPITKKGLVKWFKVLALSSSPNTAKKKKNNNNKSINK